MAVPFASPQPYDSIKHGVIVGRLTQRRLREPRKIMLLTKWKELITLSEEGHVIKSHMAHYALITCLSGSDQ